jgi:histone H3/H4
MRAPSRTFALAKNRFRELAKHYCTENDDTTWHLTWDGAATMQKFAESAVLRVLAVAIDTRTRKTLTETDVRRAHRYVELLLGMAPVTATETQAPVLFPQKLFRNHLATLYPGLRVSRAAGKQLRFLYSCIVRFLLAAVNRDPPIAASGKPKARVGPDDVVDRLDGFALTDAEGTAAEETVAA